jgi:NAD+ synthase
MTFRRDVLNLDAAATTDRLCSWIRSELRHRLRRGGAVVGLSGGIDSAVVASLCARAVGPERVLGVALPETESESQSVLLAQELSRDLGIEMITQEISAGLAGLGCYERRNEAIRSVFPDFEDDWTAKITNSGSILEKETFNFFTLTVTPPGGEPRSERLPLAAYLQIVAASNLKQRLRMTSLYYHAESRNRAVVGTANRDEVGQGFFVKYGDGGADMHPIVRLFKTQVFQLADHLQVPEGIRHRAPTTDTYSAEVSQEEFYYGLDFERMDLITFGMESGVPAQHVARALDLEEAQIERAWSNILRKRKATEYLRDLPKAPVGADEVSELDPVPASPVLEEG